MLRDNEARIEFLESLGGDQLGRGSTSKVYSVPWDATKVIKFGKRDDGWLAYVDWAKRHGYCGTFAPMVYSWARTGWIEEGEEYIAMCERLAPSPTQKPAIACDTCHNVQRIAEAFIYSKDERECMPISAQYEAFLISLSQQPFAASSSMDICSANIMWRESNRMFVINDPFSDLGSNHHTTLPRRSNRATAALWSDPIV